MKTSQAIDIFMGYQKANSGEKNDQKLQAVFEKTR